ncbi:MAG: transporter [Syntrophales bacterium]|jgi:hypothetical protein
MKATLLKVVALIGAVMLTATSGFGQDKSEEELAKQAQNPIANLISVPLQFNSDYSIGPANAAKYTLNVQPVIPFSMNQGWNLVTRTIVPLIIAESPIPGGSDKSGTGDILQSFFFTPKKEFNKWMVGGGPVLLYPTATDEALGGQKWGAGPTVVVLKQESGFTYGALANHLWSYAGWNDQPNINATFIQPFLAYTTKTYTTIGLNTESTYDWNNSQWTVPINVSLSQMLKIGNQPISLQLGYRYYAEKPTGGPDWGLRFMVSFLFPK